MIPLDLYAHRVQTASLDRYPEVWSAHYSDRLLGELAAPRGDLASTVFMLMIPFGYVNEVVASWVIFEGYEAPTPDAPLLTNDRVLCATELRTDGQGYRTTLWIVPYQIDDYGVRVFDEPYKSPFFVPRLNQALGTILDRRMAGGQMIGFEEACAVSMRYL